MNFSSPQLVGSVILTMKDADITRSTNRTLIQELMNGFPPYSESEAQENGISVNINWKEGAHALWSARRQFENAFMKPQNYFTVRLNRGPVGKRNSWSRSITKKINMIMKGSRQYLHLVRSKFAGVCLHGTGAQVWTDRNLWRPDFVPIEDLLIPTDCECSLDNLSYFAIRREYTIGELWRMTHGNNVDPGWNIKLVEKLVLDIKDTNVSTNQTNWSDSPEKLSELFKQNLAYFETDKAPTITMWDFFHVEDEDGSKAWYRKMIQDRADGGTTGDEWVYNSERVFANDLNELIHLQCGDGNNKPPFLYHSVRGIGFLLYDVVQMSNRMRCQAAQHAAEQMMMLFRVHDPADRDRVKKILLANNAIIEGSVEIIPKEQRHQIDSAILEMMMGQYRQLIGESTAAYTQQPDTGTRREQTATETMAKVQQVNSLMSSMLNMAYVQESFAYREICRRFCIKNSTDPDVKLFRDFCSKEKIPDQLLDIEYWDIEPEQVLGGGNKMMEVAQANQLMSWRNLYGPEAQQTVLHIATEAVTDDPKLAEELVPEDRQTKVSDAVHDAELSFGTLMQGIPMSIKEGYNQIEEVETLLRLMGGVIMRIGQTDNVGTRQEVIGLQTVAQAIQFRIQLIAQDPNEKSRVQSYMQMLGKMMNEVKGFDQRQQQAAQSAQQQPDPETIVKLQGQQSMNQVKLESKQQSHIQKMQQKQQSFQVDQARKNAETMAEIQRKNALTQADVFGAAVKHTAKESTITTESPTQPASVE